MPPVEPLRSLRETMPEDFTPASLKGAEIAKESQEAVFLVPIPPPAGPLRSLRSLRETIPEDFTPAALKGAGIAKESQAPVFLVLLRRPQGLCALCALCVKQCQTQRSQNRSRLYPTRHRTASVSLITIHGRCNYDDNAVRFSPACRYGPGPVRQCHTIRCLSDADDGRRPWRLRDDDSFLPPRPPGPAGIALP